MGWADQIPEFLLPGGAIGGGLWLFYRLFVRADRREKDVFDRLVDQRDHYRARAEEAERLLSEALYDLATYRRTYGPLDYEQRRRHRDRLRDSMVSRGYDRPRYDEESPNGDG